MIGKSFKIILVMFAVGVNFTIAIQCDFKYIEQNSQPPEPPKAQQLPKASRSTQTLGGSTRTKAQQSLFDCEEQNDEFEVITGVKPMGFDTRFGEDEYESAGTDCVSNKKTIQPRQLNNIYNELMHVVNTATFVQSIEIDECGTKNEPCSNGSEPPIGKKLMCRQKYVKITLKAFRDNDTTQLVDEQFYYPSHCICELVQRKRRS